MASRGATARRSPPEDCIQSIKRWAARDSMGQKMLASVAGFEAADAKTFKMKMKEPYGLVLESLGKPSSNVPFMMPKRVAETDPVHPDQGRGRDRLGSVHLHRQGMEAGREGRVRQEPDLQAARRATVGPGRRQDRQGRSPRMDLDPRRADPGGGPAERRGRHARAADARSAAADGQGQEPQAAQRQSAGQPVRAALQHAGQAVRQSQDPPCRHGRLQPGGFPQGDDRRSEILQAVQGGVRLRHAAGQRRRHG